jgi:peptidoglycan/xylan/chitin deacetylase (PgdA/CDA1 family)
MLTVVMYHYVRRLAGSRFPEIKGLERDLFIQQLAYIRRFYTLVTGQDVIDAVRSGSALPNNAALLTFDDGYLDHFINVLPILMRDKISGVFFPPARCVIERRMLDVNKIHYILASVSHKQAIVAAIERSVQNADANLHLEPVAYYRAQYAVASRFDSAEVIYIKRMLQFALPLELRVQIIDELFRRYVSSDERAFADEVYMDKDQIRCLLSCGMMIGSHGYNHDWLNHLSPERQATDIDLSLDFLRTIGVESKAWVMCYPYGGWSESLLKLLRERDCAMGFTTQVGLALVSGDDPLLLPRLDTNDLPKDGSAAAADWTLRVQ